MDAFIFYIIPTLAFFTIAGIIEKIIDLFFWRWF